MKKRYYIKPLQATGRKFPVVSFIALWLLCDRLNVPEWFWGIYWFCAIIVFCALVYDCAKYSEEPVDIQDFLKNNHDEIEKGKSFENLLKSLKEIAKEKEKAKAN